MRRKSQSTDGVDGSRREQDAVQAKRLLSLARSQSVLEIAALGGMPSAERIYEWLELDAHLKRKFALAHAELKRSRRDELKELLLRSGQTDTTFLHVALRRLRRWANSTPDARASEFDLTVLTDEELDILVRAAEINAKARKSALRADRHGGGHGQ